MTPAPPKDRATTLSDADLGHLIDVFQGSGGVSLDLRVGDTYLRLGAPRAASTHGIAKADNLITHIPSPGVGTFRAARDRTPGMTVTADTVLGHVRSLSGEKALRAGSAAVIVAQLVSDGAFVAYGEPVFEISGRRS